MVGQSVNKLTLNDPIDQNSFTTILPSPNDDNGIVVIVSISDALGGITNISLTINLKSI